MINPEEYDHWKTTNDELDDEDVELLDKKREAFYEKQIDYLEEDKNINVWEQ